MSDTPTTRHAAAERQPRHVAITGAYGGIGAAIARRFAGDGARLHLIGRNADRLQALAASLRDTAADSLAETHVADIGDAASIAAALSRIPHLDVLVNAAGSIPRLPLAQTQPSDWRGAWSDKVLGSIEATRLACERMSATGGGNGGVIINIIGTAGVRPNPRTILTTTANAALIAFTQAAGALSVDTGVRIVGINPGLTATPRTQDLPNNAPGNPYAKNMASLPFGRMAHAEEIAEAAWFLASPGASYISGATIDIDAGGRWRV